MKGMERGPVKPQHSEARKIVSINKQIEELQDILAKGVSDPRLAEKYRDQIDILSEEKQILTGEYWDRQPEGKQKTPSERLENVMDRIDVVKEKPGSYESRELKELRRQYDKLLDQHGFYVEDESIETNTKNAPHLTAIKNPSGVSAALEDARERIGHKPLHVTEQVEALENDEQEVPHLHTTKDESLTDMMARDRRLSEKRAEYGHKGLHATPAGSVKQEAEGDDTGRPSTLEEMTQKAEAEEPAPRHSLLSRIKSWFRR